jgi:hypothetical protein
MFVDDGATIYVGYETLLSGGYAPIALKFMVRSYKS